MSTTPKTPTFPVDGVKTSAEVSTAPVPASTPSVPPGRKAPPAKPATRHAAKPPAKAVAVKPVPKSPAPKVAKPAAKPLAKAFAQSAKSTPAKSAKTAKPQKPDQAEEPAKLKKLKLISDKFTLLKEEFTVLDALKKRAAKAALPAKKSALLRAGIKALAAMSDAAFATALGSLPATKPAPAKGKKA
jgi:hypothetical protein